MNKQLADSPAFEFSASRIPHPGSGEPRALTGFTL
jgi:hypothetical protein